VCRSGASRRLWAEPDRLHDVPGRFTYRACGSCASVFQSPRVCDDDLPRLYPSAYYTHVSDPPDSPLPSGRRASGLRDRLRRRLQDHLRSGEGAGGGWAGLLAWWRPLRERAFYGLVDPVHPAAERPGTALEIGPGSGHELGLLRASGWEAEGVEWDPEAAEVARRRSGCPVREGSFFDVVGTDERFDLIYMSHVLEHLPDPREALRFLGEHLSPGGRAVVITPNPRSLGARLWRRHWLAWDPPRHLVLPSAKGFAELARSAGLRASLHTRSRRASLVAAWSRAIRAGAPDPMARARDPLDRCFGALEGILDAGLGGLGEEIVLALFPDPRSPCP